MRTRMMFAAVPVLLLCATCVQADVYDFRYSGANGVFGSGTFTTGIPYGDGWVPIISITGTTEAGSITKLETSGGVGVDPNSPSAPLMCCDIGPGGWGFTYDNAFAPNSTNPFSLNGLLFDVAAGNGGNGFPLSPVSLFGGGDGNSYEFSYGEDTPNNSPSGGGTQITFTATAVTPEPTFYGVVALCLSGLLMVRWRRRRISTDK